MSNTGNMSMMTGTWQRLLLPIILLLVVTPAVILAFFSLRGIDHEELLMRQRLEQTLSLEADQTNSRIRFYLEEMSADLRSSLPGNVSSRTNSAFTEWKKQEPLVGTAFLLDENGKILWPDISNEAVAASERDEISIFYWRYLNFFSNRESIPVYKNIVDHYEEEILALKADSSLGIALMEQDIPRALSDKEAQSAPAIRSKVAADIFESNTEIQSQVYEQASREGSRQLLRNVAPQLDTRKAKKSENQMLRSVYIESTRYFQDLIQNTDYGLIPRIFDSNFILVFWTRIDTGIAGCELDMEQVKNLIAPAADPPEDSIRYINILDHTGNPVIPVENLEAGQWRQPLLAREISPLLPFWESAVILRSPELFEMQIQSSRLSLTSLILFSFALILVGIILLYTYSRKRLLAVQQRVGFVTNVSHELKTPLTSIRMYAEMLAEGRKISTEKKKKYVSYIASESLRLTRLINNVLDFAKLEKGTRVLNREETRLDILIKEIIDSVHDEYTTAGFELNLDNCLPVPAVNADREALIQVIINILSNAVKYSPDTKILEISTFQENDKTCLSITDHGQGIAPCHANKIFKEFYRIDTRITSETKGTGLGLSIARRIMKAHGGSLIFTPRIKSDHAKGSCFTLCFPSRSTQ